jgi:hypothetical protein
LNQTSTLHDHTLIPLFIELLLLLLLPQWLLSQQAAFKTGHSGK